MWHATSRAKEYLKPRIAILLHLWACWRVSVSSARMCNVGNLSSFLFCNTHFSYGRFRTHPQPHSRVLFDYPPGPFRKWAVRPACARLSSTFVWVKPLCSLLCSLKSDVRNMWYTFLCNGLLFVQSGAGPGNAPLRHCPGKYIARHPTIVWCTAPLDAPKYRQKIMSIKMPQFLYFVTLFRVC